MRNDSLGKRLYIVRHAKSSWKDLSLDDFDRPLSSRGKRDALFMGKKLRHKGINPDIIISSPALRAKTTILLIAKELGYTQEIIFKDEMYACSSKTLHNILSKLDNCYESVFLCGHNPAVNSLAQMYTGFDKNIVTSGIVTITFSCTTWNEINKNNAQLLSFIYPKKYSH